MSAVKESRTQARFDDVAWKNSHPIYRFVPFSEERYNQAMMNEVRVKELETKVANLEAHLQVMYATDNT